jgi:hypothetical protein
MSGLFFYSTTSICSNARKRGFDHAHTLNIILAILTTLFTSFERETLGRLNLPQVQTHIVISESDHATLKRYFGSLEHGTGHELDEGIGRILLDILMEDYQTGCQDMISFWGTVAEGTAHLSVRVLFVRDPGKTDSKQVLLTYRCSSTYEGYRDHFYDERLAVLLITPTTSSLALMPHAEDCHNCSDLSRIRFGEVIQHDATSLVSLLVMTSNRNPCCDGPIQFSEERIDYYLFQETGVKLVASVLRHREDYTHDDVDGDVTTIYESKITVHKDQRGNVSHIGSHYSLSTNGALQETGELTYSWDSEKREFNQIFSARQK